jgi:hypothetical protein
MFAATGTGGFEKKRRQEKQEQEKDKRREKSDTGCLAQVSRVRLGPMIAYNQTTTEPGEFG